MSCGGAWARSCGLASTSSACRWGRPSQAPLDGPLYPLLEQVLRDHDPEAVPLPFMAPVGH